MASRPDNPRNERFQRLAWPYLPVLLRTARYLTPKDADAEDLVQEAMMKALRAIDSFADGTDMKAWLLTILRRTHIDHARADQRRLPEVSLSAQPGLDIADAGPATVADPEGIWAQPEAMLDRFEDRAVIDALKTLPEEIRWTLLLVDVEQIDHAQAAAVLDVPVGTVKSRAFRGRQMLREGLAQVARERGWVERSRA